MIPVRKDIVIVSEMCLKQIYTYSINNNHNIKPEYLPDLNNNLHSVYTFCGKRITRCFTKNFNQDMVMVNYNGNGYKFQDIHLKQSYVLSELEIDHTIFRVITKWYALKPVPKKWFCSKLKMYFQATIFIQTEEKYDGSNLL